MPTENSDDATVPSGSPTLADDACPECPEIAGNDEIPSPTDSSAMVSGDPTDISLPAMTSTSATDDLSLLLDPAPIILSASADHTLSVLGSSVSLDASTESLRDATVSASSYAALDGPSASSPILVAVSSDLPLVPVAVLPDSSLTPDDAPLEYFAPENTESMTLSPSQPDPLQASVNTGAETVLSQARDDLGPPEGQLVTATTACAVSTESSLPEVSALLLDLNAPSAPLDADVTGVRVSSDAANVEVPIPPEVKPCKTCKISV